MSLKNLLLRARFTFDGTLDLALRCLAGREHAGREVRAVELCELEDRVLLSVAPAPVTPEMLDGLDPLSPRGPLDHIPAQEQMLTEVIAWEDGQAEPAGDASEGEDDGWLEGAGTGLFSQGEADGAAASIMGARSLATSATVDEGVRSLATPATGDDVVRGLATPATGDDVARSLATSATSVDVVLIDSQLPDSDGLARAVLPGDRLFLYDGSRQSAADVLGQVVQWTESNDQELGSLSILAHGAPGALALGSDWITVDTLDGTAHQWQRLDDVLFDGGNVYLFGCNVIDADGTGQELLGRLAELTGGDLFASDDVTGIGGDWQLEVASWGAEAELAAGLAMPLDNQALSSCMSNLTVTVSGTVYTDEGTTNIGANKTVRIAVNGTDFGTTAETNASGTYSISNLTLSAGDVITVYLEDETEDAVAVTVSDGSALAGLDLYQDYLVARHDDNGSLRNQTLSTAAVASESDISNIYTVSGSTLTLEDGKDLLIWTGDTFAPGGDVELGGSFSAQGTFTAGSSTVLFTGTGDETVTSGGNAFHDLAISGPGTWTVLDPVDVGATLTVSGGMFVASPGIPMTAGAYRQSGGTFLGGDATMDIDGSYSISGGTFTSTSGTMTVAGSFTQTGSPTWNHNSGTVDFDGTSIVGLSASGIAFNNIAITGTGTWELADALSATGNVTVADGTLDLGGQDLTLAGTSVFSNDGTLRLQGDETLTNFTADADSGTVLYTGAGSYSGLAAGDSYYNLVFNGPGTWVLDNPLTVNNNVSIALGTLDVSASDHSIALGGHWSNAGTFVARNGTVTLNSTTGIRTITSRGNAFSHLILDDGGGDVLFQALDDLGATGDLTITSGSLDLGGHDLTLAVTSVFSNSGTLRLEGQETLTNFTGDTDSGTTVYAGSGSYLELAAGDSYYDLILDGTGTWALDGELDINRDLTLSGGTIQQGTHAISAATYTQSRGTLSGGSALITVTGGFDQTAGIFTGGSSAITVSGNLNIAGGAFTSTSNTLSVGADLAHTGGTFIGDSGDITVSGDILLSGDTFTSTSGTLSIGGDFTHQDGSFLHNSGTIDFTKATGAQILQHGFDPFYNITHSGAGTLQVSSSWLYQKSITISSSMVSNTDQTDFPVLVYMPSDADLTAHAQQDGDDIVFTDAAGTVLSHEIEHYSPDTGELWAWVKVPTLPASTDTTLSMHYGNASCSSQQDAAGVWDGNFASVWHLKESADGTAGDYADSTSNQNDGQGGGGLANAIPAQADGKVANGQGFDGADDRFHVPHSTSLDDGNNGPFTVTLWIDPADTDNWQGLVAKNDGSPYRYMLALNDQSSQYRLGAYSNDHGAWRYASATHDYDQWAYIAFVFDGTNVTFYHNTASEGSDLYSPGDSTSHMRIGSWSSSIYPFDGIMDELRISSTARSADWIATEYNNMNDPGAYESFGSQALTGTLNIDGALSLAAGTFTQGSSGLHVAGDLAIADGAIFTKSTGGQALVLDGNGTLSDAGSTKQDLGLVRVAGTSTTRTATTAVRMTSLTINTGNTFDLGGNDFEFTSSAPVSNEGTFRLQGPETLANVTSLDSDSGTVEYVGNGDAATNTYTIKDLGAVDYYSLTINATDGATDTFQLGASIHVDGDLNLAAGTFGQGASPASIAGDVSIADGAAFTKATGGQAFTLDGSGNLTDNNIAKQDLGAVVIGGTSTTRTLGATARMSSLAIGGGNTLDLAGHGFQFAASAAVANDGTFRLEGAETLTNVTNLDTDSGTVVYVGNGDTIADTYTIKDFGGTDYYDLIINSTDGIADTFQLGADLTVSGNLDVAAGRIDLGGNDATVSGTFTVGNQVSLLLQGDEVVSTPTLDAGSIVQYTATSGARDIQDWTYGHLSINGGGGIFRLGSAGDVDGDLTITAGTFEQGSHVLSVAGDLAIADGATFTKATGGQDLAFDGTGTGTVTDNNAVKTDLGAVVIGGTTTTRTLSSSVTMTALTIQSGNTLDLAGSDLEFSGPTGVSNEGTFRLQGAENLTNVTNLDTDSGTVEYTGDGDSAADVYTVQDFGAGDYYHLVFNSLDGTTDSFQQDSSTLDVAGNLRHLAGTFTGGSDDINVSEDVMISGGAFTSTSGTLFAGNDFTHNGGNFTHNAGTIDFTKASGTQVLQYGVDPFYNITHSGTGTLELSFAWPYQKTITISSSMVSNTDQTDFPVLIYSAEDADLAANVQEDADDILFTDSSGSILPHEIEHYDSATGELWAWVKVPTLSASTDTTIAIQYGNAYSSNMQDVASVWDSNYAGVWHMHETSGNVLDSTSPASDGTPSSLTQDATGKVAGADGFGGSGSINLGTPGELQITGDQTIEMWLKPAAFNARRNPYAKAYGGEGTITQETNGTLSYYYGTSGTNGGSYQGVGSGSSLTVDAWNHVVLVRDLSGAPRTVTWYIDGSATYSTSATYAAAVAGSLNAYIGQGYVSNYYGSIDEVRMSNTARSADWVATEYNNMNDTAGYETFGSQSAGTLSVTFEGDLDLTAGTFAQGTSGLHVAGNFAIASGATFLKSTGGQNLELDGTGTLTDNNAAKQDLGAVVIGGSSTTRTLGSAVEMSSLTIQTGNTLDLAGHDFAFSSAAAVSNNGTLRMQGAETLTNVTNLDIDSGTVEYVGRDITESLTLQDFGTTDYFNLTINDTNTNPATFCLSDLLDVEGDMMIASGILDSGGQDVHVAGNWSSAGIYTAGSGTVTFDGASGSRTITSGGSSFGNVVFDDGGGEVTFVLQDGLSATGDLSLTSGVLDLNGYDLTLAATSVFSNDGTLRLEGQEILTNFTPDTDSGAVVYTGSGSYSGLAAGDSYYNLTLSGSGTWALAADLDVNNVLALVDGTLQQGTHTVSTASYTQSGGNLSGGSGPLIVTGDLNHSGGTFTGDSGTIAVSGNFSISGGAFTSTSGTLLVGGDWSHTKGVFNHNLGAVDFNGSDAQVLQWLDPFGDLTHSGTGTLTLQQSPGQSPWHDSSWLYRKEITISQSMVANTDQTDFPLLVYLASDADLAARAQSDGDDILFTDSAGTKLSHEIEYYDSGTGELWAWVKMPTLSASADTTITVYYGNATCSSQEDAAGVWDADFKGVWHLNQSGDGTPGEFLDSTSNSNDGQGGGGNPSNVPTQVDAKIGTGQDFGGNRDSIDFSPSVSYGTASTESLWINVDSVTTNMLFGEGDYSYDYHAYFTSGGNLYWRVGGAYYDLGHSWSAGTWYHLGIVRDGNAVAFYQNGVLQRSGSASFGGTTTQFDKLGAESDGANSYPLDGKLDEVRVSQTARSVDWIATSYNNQNDPGAYQTVGGPAVERLMVAGALVNSNGILDANTCQVTVNGLTTVSAGTYAASSAAQTFNGGLAVSGGTFAGSTGTVDVDGDVTISSGILTAPSGDFTLSGNWTRSGGTFDSGSNTVSFDVTSGTTTILSNGSSFHGIMFDDAGGGAVFALQDALVAAGDLAITSGTLDLNGQDLTLAGTSVFSNSGVLRLQGQETLTNFTQDTDSGTVEYVGDGDGAADIYTVRDFGATDYYNLTINSTDGTLDTFRLASGMDVGGAFMLAAGTFEQGAWTLDVAGDFAVADGAAFTKATGGQALTLDGTGDLRDDNATKQDLGAVVIGGTSTTRTLHSAVKMSSLTVDNGNTLDLNGNDLEFAAPDAVSNNGTLRLHGSETLTNVTNLDTDSGAVQYVGDADAAADSFTIKDFGAIDYYRLVINAGDGATDTFQFTSDGTITGDLDVAAGSLDLNGNNLAVSGTFSIADQAVLTLQGGETVTAPTLNAGSTVQYTATSGTHDIQDWVYQHLLINGSGGTFRLGAPADVNGDMTISAGTFEQSAHTLNVAGDLTVASGATFTKATGGQALTLDGTAHLTDNNATKQDLGAVVIGGVSTTRTLGSAVMMTSLTVDSGNILDLAGNDFEFASPAAVSNEGTLQLEGGETLTNFTADTDSGTVVYAGSGSYSGLAAGDSYYNLTLDGSGTWSLAGGLAVGNNLTVADGTLQQGTHTISTADYSQSGGVFTGGSASIDVTDSYTLSSGTFTSTSGTLSVGGDWSQTGGTFAHNSGTVDFDGSGTQTLRWLDDFFNLAYSGDGTITLEQPGGHSGWHDPSWLYRKEITVSKSVVASTDQTDFPLLIYLDSDADLAAAAQSDGDDILFADATGTKLPHEIEHYDSGTGELYAWVKIPTLSTSADTTVYVYYGNVSCSSQQESGDVWDGNFAGVWHLGEEQAGTGNAGLYQDSTSNARHGDDYISATAQDGKIASGHALDGTDDYIHVDGTSWFPTSTATISGWVNVSDLAESNQWFGADTTAGRVWVWEEDVTDELGGCFGSIDLVGNAMEQDQWVYVTLTADGTNVRLYQNGTNVASVGDATGLTGVTSVYFGAFEGGEGWYLNGNLDEVRVSDTARSADWIATSYNNQNDPQAYQTVGSQAIEMLNVAGSLTISGGTFDGSDFSVTASGLATVGGGEYQAKGGVQTFNGGLTVSGGTFTGSTGTVDVGGDVAISSGILVAPSGDFRVSGNWAKSGGTFTPGTNAVTFDATSGTRTIASSGSSFYDVHFDDAGGGAVFAAQDALSAAGDVRITSGTLDLGGQDLTLAGTSVFSNDGTLKLEGGETLTNFTGDTDSGTVLYTGSGSYSELNAGDSYYDLSFNGTGTWALDQALDVMDDLTITQGTLDVSASNHAITIGGDWSNAGTFTAQNGTVTFRATSGSAAITTGGSPFHDLVLDDGGAAAVFTLQDALTATGDLTITSGTLDLNGQDLTLAGTSVFSNEGTLRLEGGETLTNFTGDMDSGTVLYTGSGSYSDLSAGDNYYDLSFDGMGSWALDNTLSAAGDLVIISGTLNLNGQDVTLAGTSMFSNSGTLQLEGHETLTNFTGDTDSGTILYTGSGTYSELAAGDNYHNLGFNGTGTWTLDHGLDVNNDLTITQGTLDVSSSNHFIHVGGDWSNAGAFTARSGTVTFDGNGPQSITPGGSSFYDLTITNAPVSVAASTLTVTDALTIEDPNAVLDLAGYSLTVTGAAFSNHGTLRLQGDEALTDFTNDMDSGTVLYNGSDSYSELIVGDRYYDLSFSGGGSWTPDADVEVDRHFTLVAGTFTAPSGTLSVGGDFAHLGGTFDHNSGTIDFTKASGTQVLKYGTDPFYNIVHSGAGTLDLTPSWQYKKEITISSSMVANTDQTDFPVLIHRASDTDLAAHAQPDGDDIFFTDLNGVKLSHEIELYDSVTGELWAWVRIPVLSATTDTTFYMQYGNGFGSNQEDAANVWDSNFIGVWHMSEDPSGSGPQINDSTQYDNDGYSVGSMTSDDLVSSKVGTALEFDGVNDFIDIPHDASLDVTDQLSVTVWINMDPRIVNNIYSTRGRGAIVAKGRSFSKASKYCWSLCYGNDSGYERITLQGSNRSSHLGESTITEGLEKETWLLVSGTREPSGLVKTFLNGVESGSGWSRSGNYTSSFEVEIARGWRYYFPGIIDEVRISNTARGGDWIATEYNNMNDPEGYESFGSQSTSNVAMAIAGNLTNSAGTFDAGGNKVMVTGLTTVSGGTYSASTETQTLDGGLTVSGGTFTGSTGTVDVGGDVTISSGTLIAPSGTLTVSGSWANTVGPAGFLAGTGTVDFDGDPASRTISGSTTFYDLEISSATAQTVTFQSGQAQTVTSDLVLTGAAGNLLTLTPSVADTHWYLAAPSSQTIQYVSAAYSDASSGQTIQASDGTNTDGGQNVNWHFVNDPPTVDDQSFSVNENASGGTSVGTVIATDPGDTLTYAITAGNTDGAFAIDSASGEITVANSAALDFEATSTFTLTVEVTDTGASSDTATITIDLDDLNDNAPVVTPGQLFNIAEDAADGAPVGTMAATDLDTVGSFESWTIVSGNDDSIFAINAATGQVTVADRTNLDYETTISYTLSIQVEDGTNTSATEDLTINITDVNDTAPVITPGQSFNVAEDAADTTSVGTALATDADTVGSLQNWTIAGGNGDSIFAINGVTGEITVADNTNLDRETTDTFLLTLTVGDGVNTSTSETVTINVTDVNDTAPVITPGQSFNVAEDAADTASVGTVLATDADTVGSLQNWTITGGNDDSIFAIDGATGEITVADNANLDREATDTYVLTLTVGDGVNASASETVTIHVTDVNDTAPVITPGQSFNVAEDAADTTSVGTALATDTDTVGSLQSWTIVSGNDDSIFAINGVTGEITVADNTNLDRETTNTYVLTLTVGDGVNTSASETVTINVTDINDTAPVITSGQNFNVAEDAADTTSVGTALATDADTVGSLQSWTIVSGNDDGIFAIDGATGEITVADNTNLDYETTSGYSLGVQVQDGVNTSAIETVTINVTDVGESDVGAISDTDGSADTVAENAVVGTGVGLTASAVDPDAGDTVTYSLDENADGRFTIDANSGAVTTALVLDAETATGHSITVRAASTDGSWSTGSFAITVGDVNEFDTSAVTDSDGGADEVAENSSVGTAVGVTASAADADVSDSITYSLDENAGGRFAIDSGTGEITVAGSLDYETATSHSVTVRAASTDGSSSTQTFTITLFDVNDTAPVLTPGQSLDLDEDAAGGTSVGTVAATDADTVGSLGGWTITGGNDDGTFAINASTGEITVADNTNLDYETTTSYSLGIQVGDGVNTSAVEAVTINIIDVDESGVGWISDSDAAADSVAENRTAGTSVDITVVATDPDPGDTVTYSLDENAGGRFTIDTNTGVVTTAAALDAETATNHSITVRATSTDGSSRARTFTISVSDVDEFDTSTPSDSDAGTDQVAENAAVGTSVGITGSADDSDVTDSVTYSLDDDSGGRFAIDPTTGVVTVGGGLDYESAASHSVTVRATSSDNSFATGSFTVTVTDVNDNVPVVTAGQSFSLDEDAPNGTSVGSVTATDADTVGSLQNWTITSGNGDGIFTINASTGQITVADNTNLDYETTASYSLGIQADDGVSTSAVQDVTVNITNVDESGVSWIDDSDAAADGVAENSTAGTSVGVTASATDPDAGDTITYSLDDDAGGRFTIDTNTGAVTTTLALDAETATSHSITVRAASTDGSSRTRAFSITVSDVNEFDASAITDNNAGADQAAENAAVGTTVGITASADDGDVSDTLTYSLDDNAGGRFAIDSGTGVITVAGALDYETAASHSVTVRATSTDGSFSTGTFTISVTDVNDTAPVVTPGQSLGLAEDAVDGSSVGTVLATDADTVGSFQNWSIVSGNAGGIFAINASTGQITVADSTNLDYETATSHSLGIQVGDGSNTSAVQTVTIAITDVNDNAPVVPAGQSFSLTEHSPNGTSVGVVAASDADSSPILTYSITAGNTGGAFAINASTGEITVADSSPLVHETNATFELTVAVTDEGGQSGSATVTLSVVNVNTPPAGVPDSYEVNEYDTLSAAVPGVLSNDTDAEGDGITSVLVAGPAHGTLLLGADGSFTYTPVDGFVGMDSFSYLPTDSVEDGEPTTIAIEVVQTPPMENEPSSDDKDNDDNTDSDDQDDGGEDSDDQDDSDSEDSSPESSSGDGGKDLFGFAGPNSSPRGDEEGHQTSQLGAVVWDEDESTAGWEQVAWADRTTDGLSASVGRLSDWRLGGPDGSNGLLPDFDFSGPQTDQGRFDLLFDGLDRSLEGLLDDEDGRVGDLAVGTAAATVSGLAIGYAIWALRAGTLLSSLLSLLPVWTCFDPLPILENFEESSRSAGGDEEEDQETLESLAMG